MTEQSSTSPWRKRMKGGRLFCLRLLLVGTLALLLGGCSDMVLFNPKGPIGETERYVIIVAFVLMLIVVIPVMIMAFWFPWKYRRTSNRSDYDPKWNYSWKIETVIWTIPVLIVSCLGVLIWKTTYSLDPYRPLDSDIDHVTIEAVSLDWKWLFIYPEQNIAVVNTLVFPAHVPLRFKLTSDTVMTSFFIPQLGSQIYAMAGMETKLHLLANEPGTYNGQNQQYSGEGYSNMRFKARAVSEEQFDNWVQQVKRAPQHLDLARYQKLQKPSEGFYPVTYFASVKPGLFEHIIDRYRNSHAKEHSAAARPALPAQVAATGIKEN